MKKKFILVALVAFLSSPIIAQSNREMLMQHYNNSKTAYEKKDFSKFLYHSKMADSISPSHPTITYNLAAAYALTKQPEQCLKYLQKAVLMNSNLLPTDDADFDAVKEMKAFTNIVYLKEELESIVDLSTPAFKINELDLHPESIAYNPNTTSFLISSVHKNKIVCYEPKTGTYSDWKLPGADSLWAVMGMKVDAVTNELWVCTTVTQEMMNYDSTLEGMTAVLRYDLTSKKLLKRYELSGGHWFGDLVIHPSGDVYISDSQVPNIYKIDKTTNELVLFRDFSSSLFNLQGIDFNENGSVMFIADYKTGLYKFDMTIEKLVSIDHPASIITKGIDGLYFYENNLIGIHNGVRPMRVCRYKLDETLHTIIDYEYIDKAREELDEPTLGVIVNHDFYYIANSPWGLYDKHGNLLHEKLKAPIVLKYSFK